MRTTLLLLVACSERPEDPGSTPDPVVDTDALAADGLAEDLPQGLYLVGLAVSAVGGLVVPFQADVETRTGLDGPQITRFDLRAVEADGETLSEVLVGVTEVPISEAGFVAALPEFVLPAAYSVTGSDIDVQATFVAVSASREQFCGDVTGELVSFALDLAGSTFAAVPWDNRPLLAPARCDAGPIEEIPRISECPTLVAGPNTLFPSGGRDRAFEVVVPSGIDPSTPMPVVFAYHGFGGEPSDLLDAAGLRPYADALGALLVAPAALDDGGSALFDAFSPESTNLDLVLFDDLLTCVQASYAVDPDRVHVTGMSNGGLMTGYLMATRSDVIASAAPMSGGIGVPVRDTGYAMPALVIWGGESDVAFEQDFNLLALEMTDTLVADGSFVVSCDHGLGHALQPEFWPWALDFLLDHPRDLAAEPYLGGLPANFPAYCEIL